MYGSRTGAAPISPSRDQRAGDRWMTGIEMRAVVVLWCLGRPRRSRSSRVDAIRLQSDHRDGVA